MLMKCMKIRKKWCPKLQYLTIIINLVVRRLNVYVGKERMLVFPVAIPVAMTQKVVAMVVRCNWDQK